MAWGLILHPEPGMPEMIQHRLQGHFDGRLFHASHLEEAWQHVKARGAARCALVVTSLSVPVNGQQPVAIDREATTIDGFIRELHAACGLAQKPPPRVVALVSYDDGIRTQGLRALPDVHILAVVDSARELAKLVGQRVEQARRDVDIDITLDANRCSWTIRDPARGLDVNGGMSIRPGQLEKLIQDCECGASGLLPRVGRELYEHLMAHSIASEDFEINVRTNLRHPRRLETARLRFIIDEQMSPLLVEALAKPRLGRSGEDFWSLDMPIIRKFGRSGGRLPLFKDPASRSTPVDVLVIEGACEEFKFNGVDFDALPKAADEIDGLLACLARCQQEGHVGVVRAVRHSKCEVGGFGAALRQAWQERPWRLVHYAGHSVVAKDATGYLIMGSGDDEWVAVGEFARGVASAQFMFLSCCRSADSLFVRHLVNEGLPAVAGYAWPVRDESAEAFALAFYRELLETGPPGRFLEYAFTRAKRRLHDERPKDCERWISPILHMQSTGA